MSEKHINYLARTFDDYNKELLSFTKKYYPELADSLNDASVGKWMVDLFSAVGDDLSYHIDRVFQNTNINSTTSKNALMNMARLNGLKIPGKKSSMCEVEFSCSLPPSNNKPNWNYAPKLKKNTTIASGSYQFELTEDVDFAEQFNENGYSNRKITPILNANGGISGYKVSKTVIAINSTSIVYKKTITGNDIKPFMEIILPDSNVTGIESIIFKESSSYNQTPQLQDYYHEGELYKVSNESVITRRFYEVDSLSEQYVFQTTPNEHGETYEEYKETASGETVTRVYKGKWNGIKQKFITEYTDNGFLKIIFGASNGIESTDVESHGAQTINKIINNDMLGVLPQEGWTMFVLYNVANGQTANLAPGAINSISFSNIEMPPYNGTDQTAIANNRSIVMKSLTVTNLTNAIGGKDEPSLDEIRNLIKYNNGAIKRGVVLNDYKSLLANMPAKYGSPFRTSIKEENNKIILSLLNINGTGKLTSNLPSLMLENITEYLSMYKTIGDYVALKSGKIYNLYFDVNIFVDKNYNSASVISNVIEKIKNYMAITSHDMGDDIFIGDLEKEITSTDGVISIIELSVYNVYQGSYSNNISTLPRKMITSNSCNTSVESTVVNLTNGSKSFQIDLDSIDKVLYGDDDSMFEIKYPENDIVVKAKLK